MTVSDGAYFDTQDNTFPDTSLDFAPTNGSAAGVGQLTPPANGVADNGTSFLMTFTPGSFTQGETFSYNLDIDTCNNDNGLLSGEICTASEMIGDADDVFFSVTSLERGSKTPWFPASITSPRALTARAAGIPIMRG